MEVIIPTNDGITIAPDFNHATSFRCLTIINGLVKKDILRSVTGDFFKDPLFMIMPDIGFEKNLITGFKNEDPYYQHFVITTGSSKETEMELQERNYKIFTSSERNIINAINIFLKNITNRESDFCCNP